MNIDWKEAETITKSALNTIIKDPELVQAWKDAKSEEEIGLILVYVVFCETWDKAYDAGQRDALYYADMQNYYNSGGA
jgi:hypothetical protein